MKIYKSKTDKTFIVLEHEERDRLSDKVKQLEDDLEQICEEGRTFEVGINEWDLNALDWLYKMCWWHVYDDSEALDPSIKQVSSFITPILSKVYKQSFYEWLNIEHTGNLDITEMTIFMSEKRRIQIRLDIEHFGPDYVPF